MYKHILIATDGSELAGKAVTAGLALAKVLNAKVTAIAAGEPFTGMVVGLPALRFPVDEYQRAVAEDARRILAEVSEAARKSGVLCETTQVNDFPAEAVVETARTRGCDLIVMGSHGRKGLDRFLLGSVSEAVVRHVPCSVEIVRTPCH